MDTTIEITSKYGHYSIQPVRGEEYFQIYEYKRGVGSFTGLYPKTLSEAFSLVCGAMLEKQWKERNGN